MTTGVTAFAVALASQRAATQYRLGEWAGAVAERQALLAVAQWDPRRNYPGIFPVDSVWTIRKNPRPGTTVDIRLRRDAPNLFSLLSTSWLQGGGRTASRQLVTFLTLRVPPALASTWDTASPPALDTLRPVVLEVRPVWFTSR